MKSYKLLTTFAVAGLLAVGVVRVQAAHDMILNVKLTFMFQDLEHEQVGDSEVLKSTVVKLRVTNKDLVQLVARAYNTDFTGDTLAYDYYAEDFVVLDSYGNTVVNATHGNFIAQPFPDSMKFVYSGIENPTKSKFTHYMNCSFLKFLDVPHGLQFTFGGMLQMDYSTSNSGSDTFAVKITNGSGDGSTTSDGPFVIAGSISGKCVD